MRTRKFDLPEHLERFYSVGESSILVYMPFDGKSCGEIWKDIREEYLKKWIAEKPLTRPFMFYFTRSSGRGKPKSMWDADTGPDKVRKKGESELSFLKRLNLLTPEEKEILQTDSRYNQSVKSKERYQ